MSAHWLFPDSGNVFLETHMSEDAKRVARPVVVIDPNDAEDVQRLLSLIYKQAPEALGYFGYLHLKPALREFASPKPPKCDDEFRVGGSRGIHCELDAGHHKWHRSESSEVSWS